MPHARQPPKPHPTFPSKTPQNKAPEPNGPAKPRNTATAAPQPRDNSKKTAAPPYTATQTRPPAAPKLPTSAQSQLPTLHTPPKTQSAEHMAAQSSAKPEP